jgi:hypothetical protein
MAAAGCYRGVDTVYKTNTVGINNTQLRPEQQNALLIYF